MKVMLCEEVFDFDAVVFLPTAPNTKRSEIAATPVNAHLLPTYFDLLDIYLLVNSYALL